MKAPRRRQRRQEPQGASTPGGTPAKRLLDLLASRLRHRRLRLLQWLIASLAYVGAGALLVVGVPQGWMRPTALAAWASFVGLILLVGYVALRSGWSERFAEPSMTVWQLSMGVIAVNWGYVICGPMRTSALFPLMVIFAFGAFSLRYRQIAFLTVFAVASLVGAVAIRHLHPGLTPASDAVAPLTVDVNNILMILVVLPALAVVTARLSALRKKLRDQREALKTAIAEVERLVVTDELTGLPNRRSIMEALAWSTALAERDVTPFCIALIDLDHFKQVNDSLGHAAGDAVLQRFALIAGGTIREIDLLGRWGGEEFLLILPGVSPTTAQAVLQRLQAAVRDSILEGHPVTCSAGVAGFRRGESSATLLARADERMYAAKHAGRDQVVLSPS